MKSKGFLIVFFLIMGVTGQAQTPVSHPDVSWNLNDNYSDEFNSGVIDEDKWDIDVNDWGTWSWKPENAYLTDTVLTLRMKQETHWRGGQQFWFTSGICQIRETFTYGYFEARIKASEKGQGTCPAFWNYSRGQPTPTEEGGVKYCEIDAVEIFQIPYDYQRLEMNLHARIIENGVLTWKRPGQGDIELCHNTWLAPWDPRDDYHTYGVLNRLDSIFWFVDGIQRGAKKNVYWHLPMHLTVSMGLRTPYEAYIGGVRTAIPYPDSIPEPGFPTEMYCDYVRMWNTPPQLYADREKYYDAEFPVGSTPEFDCRFFAGNGETVIADGWNGMTCKLQEVQADGTVVNEIELVDEMVVGEESGIATFEFPLNDLTVSSSLPEGNRYVLKPAFRSSFDGGQDVFLEEEYYPIQLVEANSVNSAEAIEKIKIFSSGEGVMIDLESLNGVAEIKVFDFAGRQIIQQITSEKKIFLENSRIPTSGIYPISVKCGNLHRVEKVVIVNN